MLLEAKEDILVYKTIPEELAFINQVFTNELIPFLMDKNNIHVYHGMGAFKDKSTVSITDKDGETKDIEGKNIVIATGSKPNYFPGMEPDKKRIITSTEALELKEIPKKLLVIGGGVIGLELGSVYARIGSQVEVIEFAKSIIPTMDSSMGKELTKVLKKLKMKFNMEHRVQKVENTGKGVKVTALNKKEEEVVFEGDYCLVSVGRKPYTEGLGLENAGLKTNDRGQVSVDANLHTGVGNIYAIGDVVRGAMLAHKAEEEGTFVAEKIAGQIPHIDYNFQEVKSSQIPASAVGVETNRINENMQSPNNSLLFIRPLSILHKGLLQLVQILSALPIQDAD